VPIQAAGKSLDDPLRIDEANAKFRGGSQKDRTCEKNQKVPTVSLNPSERRRLLFAKDIPDSAQGWISLTGKSRSVFLRSRLTSTSTTLVCGSKE